MATSQTKDIGLGIIRYEYGEADRPQCAVLEIETSKYYNGGLISTASVYWVGENCRQQMMSLGGDTDGDYSKRIKVSAKTVKATQKAIDAQHAEVFTPEAIAQLAEYAKLHYAAVVNAGVDGFKNTYPAVAK